MKELKEELEKYAKDLGIELHQGLSFGDCRAVLPREKWKFDNGDPDEIFLYGQFLQTKYKDVTEIQMFDTDVCFAISKCALQAKYAGVI